MTDLWYVSMSCLTVLRQKLQTVTNGDSGLTPEQFVDLCWKSCLFDFKNILNLMVSYMTTATVTK